MCRQMDAAQLQKVSMQPPHYHSDTCVVFPTHPRATKHKMKLQVVSNIAQSPN